MRKIICIMICTVAVAAVLSSCSKDTKGNDGTPDGPSGSISLDVYLGEDSENGFYPFNSVFARLKATDIAQLRVGCFEYPISNDEGLSIMDADESYAVTDPEILSACAGGEGYVFRFGNLKSLASYAVMAEVTYSNGEKEYKRENIATESESLEPWLGSYVLASTHTVTMYQDGESLGLEISETPMERDITIEASDDPSYVIVRGLSSFNSGLGAKAVMTSEGFLAVKELDEPAGKVGDLLLYWHPILSSAAGLSVGSGFDDILRFSDDGTVISSVPVTNVSEGGEEYTVVAIDVFGDGDSGLSAVHELPSDIPAGTFTLTKK